MPRRTFPHLRLPEVDIQGAISLAEVMLNWFEVRMRLPTGSRITRQPALKGLGSGDRSPAISAHSALLRLLHEHVFAICILNEQLKVTGLLRNCEAKTGISRGNGDKGDQASMVPNGRHLAAPSAEVE